MLIKGTLHKERRMIRKPILISVLLMLFPGWVYALGLGNIELNSSLNEPLDARINLIGASVSELDSLKISLASPAAFQRAGVARPYSLTQLRFRLMQPEKKPAYIRISTRQVVKEPFLDFLLEVNWSTGRMFREYTVLVDPPLYNVQAASQTSAAASTAAMAPAAATSNRVGGTDVPVEHVVHYGAPAPAPVTGGQYAGGESVRIGERDTLWSIASRTRPDDSVSIQQMMLAYLRSNPQAFINDNINAMKAGYVLQMPDPADLRSISKSEALAEVRRHHDLWEQYRLGRAETPAMRAEGAGSSMGTGAAGATASTGTSQDQLKLVSPKTGSLAEGEAAAGSSAGEAGAGVMSDETALVNEKLQSTLQEMGDLRQQLHDADDIVSLMEQKLQLKDQQLAELQAALEKQQLAGQQPAPEQMPEQAPGQMQQAPEQTPAAEPPAVGATAPQQEEAPAEEAPMAAAGEPEEPMQEVEAPAPEAGLLDTINSYIALVVPAAIMTVIPGGSLTVLGVGLGLILLLLILLFGRRKGGAKETAAAPEAPYQQQAESEAVTEIASEDITENPEVTGGSETDLDTESTTQFLAEEEETISAQAAVDEEPEEDPLAEVNVYLAYERFDQAEELVKKVISEHPEEDSYRLRLLEVHYSANNKAGYEKDARELYDRVGGTGPLWDSAVAMWSEMSPGRALFEEPAPGTEAEPATEAPADQGGQGFVDLTAEEEPPAEVGGDTLNIAPGEPTVTSLGDTVSPVEDEVEPGTDTGLDFELATEAGAEAAGEEGLLDITQDRSVEGEDMLDLTATGETGDETLLDITQDSSVEGEDMLDLTATGDTGDEALLDITQDSPVEGEDMLDLTATGDTGDEALLDITQDNPVEDEDILDLTATEEGSGESESGNKVDDDMGLDFTGADDLLDITTEGESATDSMASEGGLELDLGEGETLETGDASADLLDLTGTSDLETDLLDVTATGSLEDSESESLLDVTSISAPPGGTAEEDDVMDLSIPAADKETGADDSLLDFDLGDEGDTETIAEGTPAAGETGEVASDNGDESNLEFDISGLDLESEDVTDTGGESDTGSDIVEDLETTDLSDLVAEMDAGGGLADEGGSSPDSDGETQGLDMDLTLEVEPGQVEGDAAQVTMETDELNMEDIDNSLADLSDSLADSAGPDLDITPEEGLDLEISTEDDSELLETVQLDADEEGGDELSEQTLVMPRTEGMEEQSDEDEVDTKLNLAKAYIELGDKDGARTILDEVRASGTEQQKKEAEELADQLG